MICYLCNCKCIYISTRPSNLLSLPAEPHFLPSLWIFLGGCLQISSPRGFARLSGEKLNWLEETRGAGKYMRLYINFKKICTWHVGIVWLFEPLHNSPRCGATIWLETRSGNKMGPTELIDASEVTDQCSSISEQHQMLLYRTITDTNTSNSLRSVRHGMLHVNHTIRSYEPRIVPNNVLSMSSMRLAVPGT